MNKSKIRFFLLSLAVAVPLFFMADKKFSPNNAPKMSREKTFELMVDVTRLIKSQYITETDPSKTMTGAFHGLVDSLDIMSSYLTPEMLFSYKRRGSPGIHEIGTVLYKHYGLYPRIIGLTKDSPAEKAGLEIGDSITDVDGFSTLLMSLTEARLLLQSRGPESTKLKVVRGTKNLEIELEKDILYNDYYSLHTTDTGVSRLEIHRLFPPLTENLRQDVLPRLAGSSKNLIVDLRHCCEGETGEAVDFLDIFLPPGDIGYFTKKGKKSRTLSCSRPAVLSDISLIVWTDFGTMGPAEIVTGALSEAKRAKVIGRITPGLTAEQSLFLLEDGSGLLLTTEIFHLASGRKVWNNGIEPDISIPSDSRGDTVYLQKSSPLFRQ